MRHLFTIGISTLVLFSCTPQKVDKAVAEQPETEVDAVRTMPEYAYTDSLLMGSHKVIYSITSQPDSTLQIVEDEDGTRYQESSWTLHITRDGQTLFSRSLSKANFKSQLPEDFQKLGIMDGLRFHHAEDGKLYFSTCVSFPDSDMSCPFVLTIGPDGSYTITPDTSDPDEDELPPTQQAENDGV